MDSENTLSNAVCNIDIEKVKLLVSSGVDVNAYRSGQPEESSQPDTPLKMVVFRLSDCLLYDSQRKILADIASILIDNGADPLPAFELAKERYGVDCFKDAKVWTALNVINDATQGGKDSMLLDETNECTYEGLIRAGQPSHVVHCH